jgi:hypothetical protein
VVSSLPSELLQTACDAKLPVLLVFEDDDPARPIIIDVVISHPVGNDTADSAPFAASFAAPSAERAVAVNAEGCLGRIVAVEDDMLVVECGDVNHRKRATTTVALRNLRDPVVLLTLADGTAVVVGQVYPSIPVESSAGEGTDVILKGGRVTIEADTELVLKSGTCLLRLDARGKALTTADSIVSRARGANKVQGGSVHLN